MDIILQLFGVSLFAAAIRLAMPIIAAAVGEVYTERAGILNIGVEGTMLMGAFGAVLASFYFNSPWLGLLGGMAFGAVLGIIHAFTSITLRINQVVSGIAINIFALGTTTTMARILFEERRPQVASFEALSIPVCKDIPFLGPILCQHVVLVYLILAVAFASQLILFRTTLGLRIRAVGEHPRAADAAGIQVQLIRYACTTFGGMMAGMGGAFLSIAQLNLFVDNMSAGKGWIALAAVVFGRWNPLGAMLGGLLFGMVEAIGLRAQALGLPIPHELLLMLPYLTTFLVFTGLVAHAKAPAALGRPYAKEML
jgi:simple sugar transport system permease protein